MTEEEKTTADYDEGRNMAAGQNIRISLPPLVPVDADSGPDNDAAAGSDGEGTEGGEGDGGSSKVWAPFPGSVDSSNVLRFIAHCNISLGLRMGTYAELREWSVADPDAFWSAFFDHSGLVASAKGGRVRTQDVPFHLTRFFPDARLNYAENLLRFCAEAPPGADAVVFRGEDERARERVTYPELAVRVARMARYLREDCGVTRDDVVAGVVPNTPDALVAMLAVASLGAAWAGCSPDFGVAAVLDRLAQLRPRVLFAAGEYRYAGRSHRLLGDEGQGGGGRLAEMVSGLPSLRGCVVLPYPGLGAPDAASVAAVPGGVGWAEAMGEVDGREEPPPPLTYEQVPFGHPLFVLFSSGTTGPPKGIVHSVGGTLLQHLKEHQLHCGIGPDLLYSQPDRMMFYTTCGWMMWNWQASALASGSTVLLYDGSPFHPSPSVLFDYARDERCTFLGTSAKYLDALAKRTSGGGKALREGSVRPVRETHELPWLRTIASTGSVLAPEAFDYVHGSIKEDVHLASISGGTDIVGCFVLGCPVLPVHRGEIQTAGLGMDVDVFDEEGKSVAGQRGELVCRAPFPSMPVRFWGDDDEGSRYQATYFGRFPGVWCHGDYIERNPDTGGYVIHGRSDTTLNPCGIRIGTAELYRQVEKVDEVLESIAVGQRWGEGGSDERIVLFVRLREGIELDDALRGGIRTAIRTNTSPRHVPAVILQVPDIPRTKSGKITEVAVRDVVHRREVKNDGALANPEALEHFRDREELRA